MDLIFLFIIVNVCGYAIWRFQMSLNSLDIQHKTFSNLIITILFFFPIYAGGYLDIDFDE